MRTTSGALILAAMISVTGLAAQAETPRGKSSGEHKTSAMPSPSYKSVISKWQKQPRQVAEEIVAKYGAPDGVTESLLIWHDTGPWKRTIVYRDPVPHDFPVPHLDIVEQFVDYNVPLDRYDEIAKYDGSVVLSRTTGEMSARCDKEAMNLLAINLAHEVAQGKKTVEEARQAYGKHAMAYMKDPKSAPAMTQRLQFEPPTQTADRDEPLRKQQAQR